jgi:hypothetical protein
MRVRFAALILLLGVSSHADTLVLRNGMRVSGKWWATDAKVVSFLVNDHLEFYPRTDVSEVIFGVPATPNSGPAESTSKENRPAGEQTKQE